MKIIETYLEVDRKGLKISLKEVGIDKFGKKYCQSHFPSDYDSIESLEEGLVHEISCSHIYPRFKGIREKNV